MTDDGSGDGPRPGPPQLPAQAHLSMPCKKVAIVQSSYIPWKGYFDLINQVDEFVLYDDVQFTRRDWRNRNLIKTRTGARWLTVPVSVKGKYHQKIREVTVSDPAWAAAHWKSIVHGYAQAPHFRTYREAFEELFLGCRERYLSAVNFRFIRAICALLGIRTPISWSMDYALAPGKSERLAGICRQAGACEYLSGPSARSYLRPEVFEAQGIRVVYADYGAYPPYRQMFPPFEHGVSIVDLILNEGPNAPRFMKSFGPPPQAPPA